MSIFIFIPIFLFISIFIWSLEMEVFPCYGTLSGEIGHICIFMLTWVVIQLVVGTMQKYMMTSSNGNIFRVTGPLCGEFTGYRWITHKVLWRGACCLILLSTDSNADSGTAAPPWPYPYVNISVCTWQCLDATSVLMLCCFSFNVFVFPAPFSRGCVSPSYLG